MTEVEKRKAIDLALVAMDKQFGKGAVLRLGADNVVPVAVISSGSPKRSPRPGPRCRRRAAAPPLYRIACPSPRGRDRLLCAFPLRSFTASLWQKCLDGGIILT